MWNRGLTVNPRFTRKRLQVARLSTTRCTSGDSARSSLFLLGNPDIPGAGGAAGIA